MVMTVIARDQVASDHLVYAWPFAIGPECEVSCADDEQVVMCPAWTVGDRLGPGRHRWRTPDPTRPVGAFFVLTAPVEVSFDMMTSFIVPTTGEGVRLRASGSLQVRCTDPGLLIAQFVGLPFTDANEGVLRSVSRSVERMLARLLTRRVVMSGTPIAVTEAGMLPGIIDELIAYNPTAGAVFGIELIRMGYLVIAADDGSTPYLALPAKNLDWSSGMQKLPPVEHGSGGVNHPAQGSRPDDRRHAPTVPTPRASPGLATASGEIIVRSKNRPDVAPPVRPARVPISPMPIEDQEATEETTQPGVEIVRIVTPVPGSLRATTPTPSPPEPEARGTILGIGMSPIGHSTSSEEIPTKVPTGARVQVPGPNGLVRSATVRQVLESYCELEVGSSGETIWVPLSGVVPV